MVTNDFIRSLYSNGTNGLSHQRIRKMNARQCKKLGVYPYGQNTAELDFYLERLPTAEDLKAFYALPSICRTFTTEDQDRYADYSADEESVNAFLDIMIAAADKHNCAVACAVSNPLTLCIKDTYISEKKRHADLQAFRRMISMLYDELPFVDRLCGQITYHANTHEKPILKFDYIERQERLKETAHNEANK